MKKALLIFLIITLVSSCVSANIVDDLEIIQKEHNKNIDSVSGFLKKLFGYERINLHIKEHSENTKVIGIVTNNALITEIRDGEIEKPSLNVYTDQDAIARILHSKDPMAQLSKELSKKNVTYKAVGIGNKLKYGVAKFALKIKRWF